MSCFDRKFDKEGKIQRRMTYNADRMDWVGWLINLWEEILTYGTYGQTKKCGRLKLMEVFKYMKSLLLSRVSRS